MLFNFNNNLSDKKFLISTIILLISSLFYYYLYKHNETIIEKIMNKISKASRTTFAVKWEPVSL